MIVRIVFLVGALAACGPARGADFCARTNMNQVVWTPGFEEALDGYFGGERADLYWANGRVSEQALAGLGGPPNELERLSGGLVIGSACRAHSCDLEQAAAVIQCPSRIVAVGVKHFRCGAGQCDSLPTFTIYSGPGIPGVARQRLEEWARSVSGHPDHAVRIEHRTPRRGAVDSAHR
ncbi:MAG TPA: hypothetical protein VLK84_19635 [Longimicrobium sp.]|nr:hypothetical protein [Longimicrobium sp.]